VQTIDGEVSHAARLLNQPFRKHARTGRPLVVFKSAMSLDGKVATQTGDSKWISNERSRAIVHGWRGQVDAICIGIGTALADDPLLTARPLDVSAQRAPRQPVRVVFDSEARLPLDSRLVRSIREAPLLVVASRAVPAERAKALEEAGADVIVCDGDPPDRVAAALAELGRREINSVLLEGGPTLAGSFLDAGEIDQLRLFIAPIVLGGAGARPLAGGKGADLIADATPALAVEWERSDGDLLVRARLREW
jgi:diaminohydroxyphosphoribosylaminopyrimidine deaminase/5-amino-6-(5-phosphoribosylamino)uracil reductase